MIDRSRHAAYHVPVIIPQEQVDAMQFEDCTSGSVQIVRCAGRIIAGDEVQSVLEHVSGVMDEGPAIVLNLSAVAYIDSSGLGGLVRLLTRCRRAYGDLKLCNVPQLARKALEITNLHTLFDIYDSETAAVAAFGGRSRLPEDASRPSPVRIVCLHDSVDVLAYVRTLLKGAGYEALTTTAIPDAVTFLSLGGARLILIGKTMTSVGGKSTLEKFQAVSPGTPVCVLADEFNRQEAGEAGTRLLQEINAMLR